MPKYYEYSPEDQKEIQRLEKVANGKPTVVERDTTIYPNNNKDKPFSMEGFVERLAKPIATSPEIEKQRKLIRERIPADISPYDYKMIDEINKRELENEDLS